MYDYIHNLLVLAFILRCVDFDVRQHKQNSINIPTYQNNVRDIFDYRKIDIFDVI